MVNSSCTFLNGWNDRNDTAAPLDAAAPARDRGDREDRDEGTAGAAHGLAAPKTDCTWPSRLVGSSRCRTWVIITPISRASISMVTAPLMGWPRLEGSSLSAAR